MLDTFEEQIEYWNNAHWSLVGSTSPEIVGKAFREISGIDNFENFSILEFACGSGRIYSALKCPKSYIGVDISKKYLEEFNNKYPNAFTILIDKEAETPFTNTFNIVVCIALFCHLNKEKYKDYLKELSRLTRNGGKIFITIIEDIYPKPEIANWIATNKKEFIELTKEFKFDYINEIKIEEDGTVFQTFLLFEKGK